MLLQFLLLQTCKLLFFQSKIWIRAQVCNFAYTVDLPVETFHPINHTISNVDRTNCGKQCCSMKAKCMAYSLVEPDICTTYRFFVKNETQRSTNKELYVKLSFTNESEMHVCQDILKFAVQGLLKVRCLHLHYNQYIF